MADYNDLIDKQIDYLFIKSRAPDRIEPSGRRKVQYLCDCLCGTTNILRLRDTLKENSKTHSCGCVTVEKIRQSNTRHGGSHKNNWQRLYRIWSLMKDRCTNCNSPAYKNYGARGISVCSEWNMYETFREWSLSHGYKDNLTIERIDNNGNYSPENCRWATKAEQSCNRRYCRYVTIGNETHHLSEWGRIYHISIGTISARIRSGWSPEQAITTPVCKRKNNAFV